jgi:hypothetical protein
MWDSFPFRFRGLVDRHDDAIVSRPVEAHRRGPAGPRIVRTAAPAVGGDKRRRGAHSMQAVGWRLRALRERWPAATRLALVADPVDGVPVLLGQIVNASGQSVSVRRPRRGLGELTQGLAPARLYRLRARWFVASAQPRSPCTAIMYRSVQREMALRGVRDAPSPRRSRSG